MITREKFILGFFVSVCLLAVPLIGQFQPDPFANSREPDIRAEAQYDQGLILFRFSLADNFHITDLKHKFFTIELEKNDAVEISRAEFPEGIAYADEQVFKGEFAVKLFVKKLRDISGPVDIKFTVSYQVCQERPQEVCFVPDSQALTVKVERDFEMAAGVSLSRRDESYAQWVERVIKQELEERSAFLFVLVFIAGFLTSFTPCVYPVIPIVMGYVGTRSGKSKWRGFYLSIFFVLGLALVYSILGLLAATTGTMMGISFQNPVVVSVISAIFIIMGLSLAGLFEIPVPSSISSKIQASGKSQVLGALVVGGVSGIIAAPCVGPVLIALLSWISQTGNILLGFWLTFTFSLGLGTIFLVVGTFSGVVAALPKGGTWMNYVKYFFAVLLIGGGIYFLNTITAPWLGLLLWGIFLVAAAVFLGLFSPLEAGAVKPKLVRVFLVLLFLVGAFLFIKALEMKYFPQKVGPAIEKTPGLPWISNLDEGKRQAKEQGKRLLIDTAADWCVACKELDEFTFRDPGVASALKDYLLVRLDFTEKNTTNEEMRRALQVIGMPTVIFLASTGTEIGRFSGFKNKKEFLQLLDSLE